MFSKFMLTVLVISSSILAPTSLGSTRDGTTPVVVAGPKTPNLSTTYTFSVTLSGVALGGETYSVSANPTSAFSSVPSYITATAGSSTIYFNATTSTYTGTVTLTVSGNGGSANWAAVQCNSGPLRKAATIVRR